ncbi:hypothetical protein [Deinococcus soli (ex Cha et al. 2016)]|uniref:hypothetical protein n=1 Tax=Deinococcus soli (ex Cha et al. 2016) TaxID=1309411 RepID=UPI00166E9215|nr:hypothetical protein [Deinococcus soli (ex Cha et al. 2016)]GGB71113.1 hypothetical protein GCM10008019_29140 [Deinococcus soli (ex Cha et al. 2016)]
MSPTDTASLAARLARLLPDTPDLALTGPRWCDAARMDDVAAALQAVLDTHPDGHPDPPDWVQRLLAGGHATLVEATVLLTLAPLLRRLCDAPRRRWTEQDSAAAWGVIASLNVLDRACAWWCDVLSAALEAHTTRPCFALFPWELPDAALHLITLADRAGIPVPAAFLDGSLPVLLDVLAATTPPHPLAALHRPGVLPDTPRVHRLRALLDPVHPAPQVPFGQGDHDAHRHHAAALAATLALWVEARAHIAGLDVKALLHHAAAVTLAAQSDQARLGHTPAALRDLLSDLRALHQEVGRPPLPLLRPGAHAPAQPAILEAATHALRDAQQIALNRVQHPWRATESTLWTVMDALETEEDADALRAGLALVTRWALMDTPRAPGMALPDVVELACEVSGVPPLWGWPVRDEPARQAVQAAVRLLSGTWLYWRDDGYRPARRPLVHALLGHALAVTRRHGLSLPEADLIGATLARAGDAAPLRTVPLSSAALRTLMAGFDATEPEPLDEPGETPAEAAEPEAAPEGPLPSPVLDAEPAWPAHVLDVRALLAGQRVVLLGGVPYPEHHRALVEAFDLAALDWIPSDRYDHGLQALAHVRQPGTALVIFALRWGAHAHASLREAARSCGVPYLLHPAGLNPSQIAWQIGRQVSDALRARQATLAMPA